MKRRWLVLLLVILSLTMTACQSEQVVSFSDDQLESILREEIDKTEGELYESDFEELTELDLADEQISSLDGIEILDSLNSLNLEENEIDNLSPLTDLEALEELYVSSSSIGDGQQAIIDTLSEEGIAVTTIEPEPEIVGSADGPGGFLWKVENGDTTVYLQGTIHVGIEDLFPLHESIENAYRESDIIVPEIDLNNINMLQLQNTMMELGTYQDDTTIKDHIPEDLYNELDALFSELGVPLQLMEVYKPWMLSNTIQQLMLQELDYIAGVDEYFLARAEEDGKEIHALETAEEQFNVLADVSPEFQIELLEESLVDIEDYDENMRELLDLYMEGDIDQMLEGLTDEDAEPSEDEIAYMEALNDDRNYNMAEQIAEFLEEDSGDTYFVIVGTLHYIMEPHIGSILEEEGYSVEHIH